MKIPAPQTCPRITVVTPSFNQGQFLEETILSVLNQNYPNLQYIVVDGNSTDQSADILDRYADQISIVVREPDDGQSDAIGKGLALADGEWFNWINSDDLLTPGTLSELGRKAKPSIDLYTFDVSVFGTGTVGYTMNNRNLSAKAMLRCDRYSFSQPGLWFRTRFVHDCGGIDRSLNYGFDWDLLVRYLAAHPSVYYSKSVGAGFRLHDQSKTVLEYGKEDEQENRFLRESIIIRDKLESLLRPKLANASRLGRLREPWNDYLVESLDRVDASPIGTACKILKKSMQSPHVRLSPRTFGSVARLLSRYVRPRPVHPTEK